MPKLPTCSRTKILGRRKNFLLQGQLSVLTRIFRCPFHSRVTEVARKRSWSFCQKCRRQVLLLLLPLMTIGHKAGHYCHFSCMLGYFVVSIVRRTLTWTAASLTSVYTRGTSMNSLIRRKFVTVYAELDSGEISGRAPILARNGYR